MENKKFIRIRGAAENNLKHIDLDIPRDELVVLTGLSGSGKSSLAFIYFCFAAWGFFRAFFDANTYSVLYDVTPERLHASCGSVMGMTGFAVGAFAPLVLGAMKQSMGSLSSAFPLLALIWIVCGLLMFVVARFFYAKDRAKIQDAGTI